MNLFIKIISGLLITAVTTLIILLWIYRDIPADELERKYATAPSKFVPVGGVRYHVRQEGHGPDVVLLHASFGNLFMWDEWVTNIADNYRVTRLDLVAHGLTGSGANEPYSTDDLAESLHGLLTQLNIRKFHLVGTSLGGILAFTYAADYSPEVSSLTLINSAGLLHKSVNPNMVEKSIPWKIRLLSYITPRYLIDDVVSGLIRVKEKITPKILTTYYEMLMRDGNRQATLRGMANYKPRDPAPWLEKVTAPSLIIWSDGSVLPKEESTEFVTLLKNSVTQSHFISGGGHALPISHPIETSEMAKQLWEQVDNTALETEPSLD
jgi:pimeloyl-ACP methyl ester carboxylesterase